MIFAKRLKVKTLDAHLQHVVKKLCKILNRVLDNCVKSGRDKDTYTKLNFIISKSKMLSFFKNYVLIFKMLHAYLLYACNIYAMFQIDRFKTVEEFGNTNLLFHTHSI